MPLKAMSIRHLSVQLKLAQSAVLHSVALFIGTVCVAVASRIDFSSALVGERSIAHVAPATLSALRHVRGLRHVRALLRDV